MTELPPIGGGQATSLVNARASWRRCGQDRLLNAYLVGTIEEVVYKAKSNELKAEAAKRTSVGPVGRRGPGSRGSNNAIRREILDSVCLNRTLGDVNRDATKRKPFDVFAEGLEIKNSRGEPICLRDNCTTPTFERRSRWVAGRTRESGSGPGGTPNAVHNRLPRWRVAKIA